MYGKIRKTADTRFKPQIFQLPDTPSNAQRARQAPQDGYVRLRYAASASHRPHIPPVRYAAAALATNPEKSPFSVQLIASNPTLSFHILTAARARGEYLRTHFKNMREVAAALSGVFMIRRALSIETKRT